MEPPVGQAVGTYRILRGNGSGAGDGGVSFTTNFIAAQASLANGTEQNTQQKVAYGVGVSAWCATCHPDMHTVGTTKLTHPVDQGFSAAVSGIYNSYLGSGTTGSSGFDSIVPFGRVPLRLTLRCVPLQPTTLSPRRRPPTRSGYVPFLPPGARLRIRISWGGRTMPA